MADFLSQTIFARQISNHLQRQKEPGCLPIPPKGATANAVMYTIVESAKANDLNVYEYLKFLHTAMPDTDFNNHPDRIDSYLPWSKELPEECRLTKKVKKHFI